MGLVCVPQFEESASIHIEAEATCCGWDGKERFESNNKKGIRTKHTGKYQYFQDE